MEDGACHGFDRIEVGSTEGYPWERVEICRFQVLASASAEARHQVAKAECDDRRLHAMTVVPLRGCAS